MIANEPGGAGGAAASRSLLRWGMVAGPFYLTVGLAQAFLREGFDLTRHPLSLLANGPFGWLQTANFVLSALMVLAAAVGIHRVLGAGSRGMTLALGVYGIGMLLAALFPADPVDGFPRHAGRVSGRDQHHGHAPLRRGRADLRFPALAGFFAAGTFARRKMAPLALASLGSGLAVGVGFFGGIMLPLGIGGIWFAVVIGWTWLALVSHRLAQMA